MDRSLGAGHAMGDDRLGLRAYMMPVYAALFAIVFSGPLIGLVKYVFQIDGESLPKGVADGMAGSVMSFSSIPAPKTQQPSNAKRSPGCEVKNSSYLVSYDLSRFAYVPAYMFYFGNVDGHMAY